MNTAVTATSQGTKPTQWQIDPAHSAAHFSVRHLMISNVRGEFSKLSGSVLLDPADGVEPPLTQVGLHGLGQPALHAVAILRAPDVDRLGLLQG